MDLSVIIPARNEEWLVPTVEDVLKNSEADTEVIVILDGYWPEPGIADNPKVKIIHHSEPIGQRQATNEGIRLSEAKYIMKLDAHCCLDKGFDVKLMANMEYDWTVVPRMYNMHVFDWKCVKCGKRSYMGPTPTSCKDCDNTTKFKKRIVWKPRRNRRSDFMRFDSELHFQYWKDCGNREESKGDIADLMCCLGACWFMDKDRYWELGGMDEGHGSWGQMGVEVACKAWLSGGRLVSNKDTWFSHMFRTQSGFGFPYQNPGHSAKEYSRDLWENNKWEGQVKNLSWLIKKFWPIPGWEIEDLQRIRALEK